MNLSGVPIEVLYDQLVYPPREQMKGKRFKIAHLKSERGQQLNGQIGTVTGFNRDCGDARLHFRLKGTEPKKSVTVKLSNLVPVEAANEVLENFMGQSTPMPDDILAPCLEQALQQHSMETDRQDLRHRLGLYKTLLEKIQTGKEMQDGDYCFPCGAGSELLGNQDNFGRLMQLMRQGCLGDETCDIRYMDRGLKGDDHTECPVCQEVLTNDTSIVLVTLPCLHVFHEACIRQWLGSNLGQHNWNCPSCRKEVPGDMSIYCIHHDEQLQRRIDECPLSGYCTKCIIKIMECNRHEQLPIL